jgi:O-antigen/teichoic acid export membrane protein
LTRLLITFTVLFSQLASLGGSTMLVKFIPNNNDGKGNYNGIASFIFCVGIIGFLIILLSLLFGKPIFEYFYTENSKLFIEYFYFLIPLIFFQILINYFNGLLHANFQSVFPHFINEILIKLFSSLILITYCLELIDFYDFMVFFVLSYAIASIVLFRHIYKQNKFSFKFKSKAINKTSILSYGIANTLTSLASNLTNRIDVIMIGSLLGGVGVFGDVKDFNVGLYYVTIYTIASYMATLLEMPARALANIASTIISKAWNNNDLKLIGDLYEKSSINQLAVGVLIFLGIWVNIDELLIITGKDYSVGKWVFLFLSIGKLINIASGVNGKIIILSRYYLVGTYFTLLLVVVTFFSNLFFIPYFESLPNHIGIEGAALATALSVLLFNFFSFLFLFIKYKLQPFSLNTILVLAIAVLTLLIVEFINFEYVYYFEIIINSLMVSFIFIPSMYFLKVSTDFNRIIDKFLTRFFALFLHK